MKRQSVLHWTGPLQPTALSRQYRLRLRYEFGEPPQVWVLDPPLQEHDGEPPPHLYADGTLCLYLPKAQEWASSMSLADTILLWAAEWLLHYEIWLATGEWHGGGTHPGDTEGESDEATP